MRRVGVEPTGRVRTSCRAQRNTAFKRVLAWVELEVGLGASGHRLGVEVAHGPRVGDRDALPFELQRARIEAFPRTLGQGSSCELYAITDF